jgi:RecB family exonuclease
MSFYPITQIVDYAKCPMFYYFRYIYHFSAELNRYLGFGIAVHHVLQKLLDKNLHQVDLQNRVAVDQALTPIIEKEFQLPFVSSKMNDRFKKTVKKQLSQYIETFGAELQNTHKCEAKLELLEQNAVLIGIADILIDDNANSAPSSSGITIWDHKTTKIEDQATVAFQIQLYGACFEAMGKHVSAGIAAFLNNLKKMNISMAPTDLAAAKVKAMDIIRRIRANDFTPEFEVGQCPNAKCDYFSICPYAETHL